MRDVVEVEEGGWWSSLQSSLGYLRELIDLGGGGFVFSTDRIRLIRSKWDGGLSARVSMNATAYFYFSLFSYSPFDIETREIGYIVSNYIDLLSIMFTCRVVLISKMKNIELPLISSCDNDSIS